jgi:hypothetical protein
VQPSDFVLLELEPAMTVSILPDLSTLFSQLTVNEGYHSDTFTTEVAIEPLFFDFVPEGATPLTGVRVEFGSGAQVELSPALPSATVELRMPLLPRLMNSPDAQSYQYKVTNLHAEGPGLSADWRQGSGNLFVIPAGAGG